MVMAVAAAPCSIWFNTTLQHLSTLSHLFRVRQVLKQVAAGPWMSTGLASIEKMVSVVTPVFWGVLFHP